MRQFLLIALVSAGCVGTSATGDDMSTDPGTPGNPGNPWDPGTAGKSCPIAATNADPGPLTASKAEMCNVSGSMGKSHWYKLAAALPGSMNYVQVDLWDGLGAFTGGLVHTGTFTITAKDADPNSCGVCVRGLGAK